MHTLLMLEYAPILFDKFICSLSHSFLLCGVSTSKHALTYFYLLYLLFRNLTIGLAEIGLIHKFNRVASTSIKVKNIIFLFENLGGYH